MSRTVTGTSLSKPLEALIPLLFAHPSPASVSQMQVCFCSFTLNKQLLTPLISQALFIGAVHTSENKPSPCLPGDYSPEKRVHRWTSGCAGKSLKLYAKECVCVDWEGGGMSQILKWPCDSKTRLRTLISLISKFLAIAQAPLWCLLSFGCVYACLPQQLAADSWWQRREAHLMTILVW